MKIPKNFFNNLSATKYREYLKLLPSVKQENTRIIVTLILTFFAMSFFGIFAINPTLSTIVKLRKQLADSEKVYFDLRTKKQNLSNLSQQYDGLGEDLAVINNAIPQEPRVPSLMGEVLGLAQEKQIQIQSLNTSSVALNPIQKNTDLSFTFSLQARGEYTQVMDFAKDLTNISRVITIESISISKASTSNNIELSLVGKAYYRN